MGPIEALWGSLIVVFIFAGLVRGFLRELGVTTVLIAMLLGYDRLIPVMEDFINKGGLQEIGVAPLTGDPATSQATQTLLWLVLSLLTVLIVFVAYQGETLSYEGTNPRFPVGTVLSLLVGLINGYLITGMLWWILVRYDYPIQQIKFIDLSHITDLTPLARSIVVDNHFLPLDLLGNGGAVPNGVGSVWLPLILVVLIVLKVLR